MAGPRDRPPTHAETAYSMATASVAQNATMKSYEQIRAPFDGVVTARFVDVGALVQNSTTNKTSNQPVLTIADDTKLRVDVYVEQRDVPFVHVGDVADVADGSDSARKVKAQIARTSNELDPRTRTLFVELDVDNADHFLVPGSFAYVTLHIPVRSYPEVPVAGLIVRGTKTMIADLGSDQTVHLRPVTVASTDGIRAMLSDGATVGQRVAINLPDEVGDGGRVQVGWRRAVGDGLEQRLGRYVHQLVPCPGHLAAAPRQEPDRGVLVASSPALGQEFLSRLDRASLSLPPP